MPRSGYVLWAQFKMKRPFCLQLHRSHPHEAGPACVTNTGRSRIKFKNDLCCTSEILTQALFFNPWDSKNLHMTGLVLSMAT